VAVTTQQPLEEKHHDQ